MDSLRIGFFHDSAQRDHQLTLAALEDAYRRGRSTVATHRIDAQAGAAPIPSASEEPLTLFDAIALEPEFADHIHLRDAQFLFDGAVDFTDVADLDAIAVAPRVAALDLRPFAQFGEAFDREIPLLPAPLASHRSAPAAGLRLAAIVNDEGLQPALAEFRDAWRTLEPDVPLTEIFNPFRSAPRQSQFMSAAYVGAQAHVHFGPPSDAFACGRLIDSMNLRIPVVLLDGVPIDDGLKLVWRRPTYQHDVHLFRAQRVEGLVEAARAAVRDAAYAQRLIRNALREVAAFHEEVQKSLLISPFAETYLGRAS